MIDILIKMVQMNIITNIVAGIILFIVLKQFVDWQNERRQLRITDKSNDKVFTLLKPYIANGEFPAPEVFQALIATVARDHGADPADLYSVKYCCQEFIRSILENEYLPQEHKIQFTSLLKEQIVSYEQDPARWSADAGEDPFVEKRKYGRFNHHINLCTFLTSGIIMVVNVASGANDLYESLAIFAVVLLVLILVSEVLIKRGHYRNIPGFLRILQRKTSRKKESWDKKKAEKAAQKADDERVQLRTENAQLIEELQQLRAELTDIKNTSDSSMTADSIPEPDLAAVEPAEADSPVSEFSLENLPIPGSDPSEPPILMDEPENSGSAGDVA